MDPKVATFLSGLSEPRFSSRDRDPEQPIVLRGMYDGRMTEFVASPTDPMPYGRELHRRVVNGELGPIGDYVEREK